MSDEDVQVPQFGYCALYMTKTVSAPVAGESVYFVVKQTPKEVTLLHPFSLAKLTVANTTFQEAMIKHSWEWNKEKIVTLLKGKLAVAHGSRVPRKEVEEIIKHYSS